MIGVAVHPSERVIVAEFFELFKTPWEFYRSGGRYDVVLCTSDDFRFEERQLVVILAGAVTPFDTTQNTQVKSRLGGFLVSDEGKRLPIYGAVATFPGRPSFLLQEEATQEPAAFVSQCGDASALRVGYNLFKEVHYLLTVGQPAANAGTPTLEEHIGWLRDWLTLSGIPSIEIPPTPDGYDFIACLTHDIDHPSLRNHWFDHTMFGFLYRSTLGTWRDVLRGRKSFGNLLKNGRAACLLPFVHLGIARDFWLEFDRYLEMEAGAGSTFFVIPRKDYPGRRADGSVSPLRACQYDIDQLLPQLKRIVSAGGEVGVHGLDAWLDVEAGRKERERVSRAVGVTELGVRMHWLFFDENSPSVLDRAGFTYDSTVGYRETVGYRTGTMQAYAPPGVTNLLELPLHVMDTALFYPGYLNLGEKEAERVVFRLMDNAERIGGALTLNWHDRSIAPERLWGDFYLRDAMGIKLVYYRLRDGQLTFGSEIRAVLAADTSRPPVDPLALDLFLRFRYTPSPFTIFQGIRKLAPGTMLVVEDGKCCEERWYNYQPIPFSTPKEEEEAEEELLNLYEAAVGRHLLSDVPVGILLSGGVDSALLLALMNQHGGSWPAYTVGYGEAFEDDEIADAAETASLLGARHIPVRLDREEFERSLPNIVACLEEPIASSSVVPMYLVCERARQDVKVALIGQGPDEVFGGYKRHLGVHYGNFWRGLPESLRRLVGLAANHLPRNETLKRGINSLGVEDRLQRYQHVFSLVPAQEIDDLFRDELLPNHYSKRDSVDSWRELLPQMEHIDELGGFQLLEIRSSLPDELLMFADKLSMAHSLEVRVPYLDRTIVEYAQRLGSGLKVRNGAGKWLHRKVCNRFLDPRILKRKKRGFAVNVVDSWFQSSFEGKLPEMLLDESSLIYDLLKPAAVRRLLEDHRSGRQDNHKLLFSLVMAEQWMRVVQAKREQTAQVSLK